MERRGELKLNVSVDSQLDACKDGDPVLAHIFKTCAYELSLFRCSDYKANWDIEPQSLPSADRLVLCYQPDLICHTEKHSPKCSSLKVTKVGGFPPRRFVRVIHHSES